MLQKEESKDGEVNGEVCDEPTAVTSEKSVLQSYSSSLGSEHGLIPASTARAKSVTMP